MTPLSTRRRFGGLFCAGCAALAGLPPRQAMADSGASAAPVPSPLTPDQALARLQEGNRRFMADAGPPPDVSAARRQALLQGQAPHAALLGCADSRAAPELIFSAGLGEMTVIRVSGSSMAPSALGSLQYSVLVLKVPLIVVLGHAACGAVVAALEASQRPGGRGNGPLAMPEQILPAIAAARGAGGDLLEQTTRAHAIQTARQLRHDTPALTPLLQAGRLRVVSAYYRLEDGGISWMEG